MAELSDTVVTTRGAVGREISNALFDIAWKELDVAVRKSISLAAALTPEAEDTTVVDMIDKYGRGMFAFSEAKELALMLRKLQKRMSR